MTNHPNRSRKARDPDPIRYGLGMTRTKEWNEAYRLGRSAAWGMHGGDPCPYRDAELRQAWHMGKADELARVRETDEPI